MSILMGLRRSRQEILGRIALIEEMRRGSVTRQFMKIKAQGKSAPMFRGPYALYTFKRKGKTVSRRVHDVEEVRRLERQVENYHLFQRLCRRLIEISEAICDEKEGGS